MAFSLGARAADKGYRLFCFETVGSTNAEAMTAARSGEAGPAWFVSGHQSQGRGRRGRAWQTEPGNLAASLLMTLEHSPQRMATLGFVAGLALSDALARAAPDARIDTALDGGAAPGGTRFELKWPNDLIAGGAKLAGIMLESEQLDGDRSALVTGIGVNVVSAPRDVPYPATCLRDLGSKIDAAGLFAALSDAWVENYELWESAAGIAAVREKWLARAAGIGGPVAVRIGSRIVRGTFESLDIDGRLLIREPDGHEIAVAAGEVHFGAVASIAAAD
ncbi:MAG: biotin--[acetyl-CoA-carboxylase] ligase [Flavobacteriaceae bacterium]